jgi:hypothetical protein
MRRHPVDAVELEHQLGRIAGGGGQDGGGVHGESSLGRGRGGAAVPGVDGDVAAENRIGGEAGDGAGVDCGEGRDASLEIQSILEFTAERQLLFGLNIWTKLNS